MARRTVTRCAICGYRARPAREQDDLPPGRFVHCSRDAQRDIDLDGHHDAEPQQADDGGG